ncbi:MAG: prepilin peptidase [Pseudomonadota bacterium]
MTWFVLFAPYIFVFIFGACIGSFLNVVIYRLPVDESIAHPPSHCFTCGSRVKPYENIPMLSYVFLKGRCGRCKSIISPRYFFVELITACLAMLVFHFYGYTYSTPIYFAFIAALIIVTFIDIDHRIIPDSISIGGTIFGIILAFFFNHITFLESFIGASFGFIFLALIAFGYLFITGREGMGGGDIKLIAMIGAFLGIKGVLYVILISSVLGVIYGLSIMLIKKEGMKYQMPYGPFLAIGALIISFTGADLLFF